MTQKKAEQTHRKHRGRLDKMQARRAELMDSFQKAKDALKVSGFAEALIAGDKPADKLAGDLSRRRNEVSIYEGAIAELDSQISTEQAAVEEAAATVANEAREEAERKIRSSLEQVVRGLAETQLELARCGRLALKHNVTDNAITARGIHDVGGVLAQAADLIEKNEQVRAALDVPRGGRCAGFIDNEQREASRGAAILEWAWRETVGVT